MGGATCTVTFEDGRRIDYQVLDFTVEYQDSGYDMAGLGSDYSCYQVFNRSFEICGIITEETIMKEKKQMNRADELTSKLKKLELGEDERILVKYNVLDDAGLLTNRGLEVVVNELFTGKQRTALVEKLKRLEEEK